MMSCFSIPVGIKDSNEVELLSAIKALELSSSYYIFFWRNFIFEFDFVYVVNWLINHSIKP
jgi:hypothetical protein